MQHTYLREKETLRLNVKPLKDIYKEPWMEFCRDASSFEFFPEIMKGSPEAVCENWFRKQYMRYEENRFGLLALIDKNTGKFCGMAGLLLHELPIGNVIEIGYHILPSFRRMGYATEAAMYLKDFALNNLYIDTIVSLIHPKNQASITVAKKNGFVPSEEIEYFGMPCIVFRNK